MNYIIRVLVLIYNTTYWLQWANEQVCIDSKIARSCNIKFYLSVSDQLVDVEKSRCVSVKLPINRRYWKDTASTPEEFVLTRWILKSSMMHEIAFFLWLPKSFSHIKNLFWLLLMLTTYYGCSCNKYRTE